MEKEEILVSVIVPVFNAEKYVKTCIESILKQTYSKIEVILIEDGSTDNSKEVIMKLAEKDKRIGVFSRENKGAFETRKEGIQRAKGEYLCFVDSDDWIEEKMIEELLKIAIEEKADMVRASYYIGEKEVTQKNKPAFPEITKIRKEEFPDKLYPILLHSSKANSLCGQIVKKECLEGLEKIDCDFFIGEDLYTNLYSYAKANTIVWVPEYFYHYRKNNESITKKETISHIEKKIESCLKSHAMLVSFIEKEGTKKQIEIANLKMIAESAYLVLRLLDYETKENRKQIDRFLDQYLQQENLEKARKQITKDTFRQAGIRHHYFVKAILKSNKWKMRSYTKTYYRLGRGIKKIKRESWKKKKEK